MLRQLWTQNNMVVLWSATFDAGAIGWCAKRYTDSYNFVHENWKESLYSSRNYSVLDLEVVNCATILHYLLGFVACGFVNTNVSERLGGTLLLEVVALLTNYKLSYPRTEVYSTAMRTFRMRHWNSYGCIVLRILDYFSDFVLARWCVRACALCRFKLPSLMGIRCLEQAIVLMATLQGIQHSCPRRAFT